MADDAREAAMILRGLKQRVERLESATFESGTPHYLAETDVQGLTVTDAASVSATYPGGSFRTDSSVTDGTDVVG